MDHNEHTDAEEISLHAVEIYENPEEPKQEYAKPSQQLVNKSLQDVFWSLGRKSPFPLYHVERVKLAKVKVTEGHPTPSNRLVSAMKRDPSKVRPIIVRKGRGRGRYKIVDGHHRYEAAKEIGLDWLWMIVLEY